MFPRRLSHLSMTVLVVGLVVFMGACASHKRPVLYPNAHLKQVGDSQAQADIDACFAFAESQVKKNRQSEEALKGGAKGATMGAAGGAVGGAVSGSGAGRGALTGAAAGAAIGVVSGLWKGAEPDPVFKRFVEQCLRDKGYDPKGWQ